MSLNREFDRTGLVDQSVRHIAVLLPDFYADFDTRHLRFHIPCDLVQGFSVVG